MGQAPGKSTFFITASSDKSDSMWGYPGALWGQKWGHFWGRNFDPDFASFEVIDYPFDCPS